MRVLVLNCGSSSLKGAILDPDVPSERLDLSVQRIGSSEASVRIGAEPAQPLHEHGKDHQAALLHVLPKLLARLERLGSGTGIEVVGHRVVHGGEAFVKPTIIDDAVEAKIDELSILAPLHNPANLAGIRAARAAMPDATQVAVFDTAFHATLPRRAAAYALPAEAAERAGIRRYGFHGTSHAYVSRLAAEHLDHGLDELRIITCHLGNGASACAVEYGRSVETSMGLTPLEGLVMGTRCGDVDPGALLALARSEGLDLDGLDAMLNTQSGLAGLSGAGRDMRDIEERAAAGDERCRLAIHVFTHRLRKYIGAYAAVMGGVDAIAFCGGIGENSALIRHRVLQRLDYLGARIDEDKNRDASVSPDHPVVDISSGGRVALLVVQTDEQLEIARQADAALKASKQEVSARPIPIAVSARHIHLTEEMVERLFGKGHTLTPRNPLSQPGQFACEETVDLIGPKRTIERVRVLGPTRPKNQIEISRTDEFHLGLDAPVRASGDVDNSPGITLRGPLGEVQLDSGVICAWRHIHMTPEDAEHYGVRDKDIVSVRIDSDKRDLTFGDVMVRVSPKYALEMHIDTDEANAAELTPGTPGMLERSGKDATLVRKQLGYEGRKRLQRESRG